LSNKTFTGHDKLSNKTFTGHDKLSNTTGAIWGVGTAYDRAHEFNPRPVLSGARFV
jgi:hypothetical protein